MNEFDLKYDIVDEKTPPNVPLRAHYKRSFAYYTIRERLPVILTQVLDQLSQDKDAITDKLENELVRDDIKEIQGGLSKLKYELQTDKKFTDLDGIEVDRDEWNEFLGTLRLENRDSYYTSTWLYTECYMYRRIKSLFEKSKFMKDFDYFRKQKETALTSAFDTIQFVVKHVKKFFDNDANQTDMVEQHDFFVKMLKLSLWGNRCDLSISLGRQIHQTGNAFDALVSLEPFILVDKTQHIWECVLAGRDTKSTIIDFVLDNSGYELFTDLLLAHFLIRFGYASKVRFHVKAIPWFISDVMPHDFEWTLNVLQDHSDDEVAAFGRTLSAYVKSGQFEVRPVEYFWTGPYEFHRMATVRSKLYQELGEAHLVLFKGDLNYRKLLADFNWSFQSTFDEVLQGFRPTNVCSLRTVKGDVICELKPGVDEELSKEDSMWMETGQYGVIHFASA